MLTHAYVNYNDNFLLAIPCNNSNVTSNDAANEPTVERVAHSNTELPSQPITSVLFKVTIASERKILILKFGGENYQDMI